MAECPRCGRTLDEHNRHLRFQLPDPVLDVAKEDRACRTWGNDLLLQVQGVGAFVRVMVVLHLTGGYSASFATWLSVHPDDLRRAWEVWEDEVLYPALTLDGILANGIPSFESVTLAKPAHAEVRNLGEIPYVCSSPDADFDALLNREWEHERVLAALEGYDSTA